MIKLRVIGVGSVQGDDKVGWAFIDFFQAHAIYDVKDVEVIKCQTPATELFHLLQGAQRVILIDAVASDQAGKLYQLDLEELHLRQDFISSHGMDVVTALDLAKALNQLPSELSVFGVGLEAAPETLSGELSDDVKAALPGLLEMVVRAGNPYIQKK